MTTDSIIGAEPVVPPRRGLGAGAITGFIAAGVVTLALVFGGGMATAWAIGPLGGAPGTSFGGDRGQPPSFGGGGPQEQQGVPGQREDQESDGGSDGSAT